MRKYYYSWAFLAFFICDAALAATAVKGTGFNMAAQLLSAARNGNTRLIQDLINSGADVNYVDSTGLSVVCTAVMNNDTRAVQVLQMYGADASGCDRQIKNYKARIEPDADTGLFSGLSPTHKLVLSAVGVGAVVGGLLLATDAFDSSNNNVSTGGSGSHSSGGGGSSGGGSGLKPAFTIPYGPSMVTSSGATSVDFNYSAAMNLYSTGGFATNFSTMNGYGNYLLMMHGYSPFARGYLGQVTLRSSTTAPVPASVFGANKLGTDPVTGGLPLNVALITANGINAADNTSLADRFFIWSTMTGNGISDINAASNNMISSKYFNNQVILGTDNASVLDDTVAEIAGFDLSGNGTAIANTSASDADNLLAKIVGGYTTGDPAGDFTGFAPNGQLTIYRTGGGKDNLSNDINYYNYKALVAAASNSVMNMYDVTNVVVDRDIYGPGRARINVIANADVIEPLHETNVETLNDFIGLSASNYKTKFYEYVGKYYGNGVDAQSGIDTPAQDAENFFSGFGISYFPLTAFSTGAALTDSVYSGAYKDATFENAVPLAFNSARGLFMSVVAVNLPAGATATASNVSGFSTSEKYGLSQWSDGTNYYKSRICGVSGTGGDGVDPWCFAAVGVTDEQATAAAAGAAAVVKSAFGYLSNKSVFNLLALTADGAYLGTNPATGGTWGNSVDAIASGLTAYLSAMYKLPQEYQTKVDSGTLSYIEAFKQVYGYGLINLERATMPGKSVYYYSDGKIVSAAGNAYWRSATDSVVHASNVFGARAATLPVSFYDVVTSADGDVSVPRVWNTELSFGNDVSHGLYMGDTLAELKTRNVDNSVEFGNFKFNMARSERAYEDNMGGVDNLSMDYDNGKFGFSSSYQHYLTDGAGRFTGLSNPVRALASDAVTSGAVLHFGEFAVSGRGFVGNVTVDGLLENDPVVSSNFESAKLGNVMGAESGLQFKTEKLSIASNVGTVHESNTVLGAAFGGMLNIGGADTNYVDSVLNYAVTDDVDVTLRGTFAWTNAGNTVTGIVNGLSELKSNAFAAGLRFGNFDFAASMPLAVTDGRMYYSYADFDVDDDNNLTMRDAGECAIDLTPDSREYRFNASYRHSFGEWTDGALGFIYRVHPNNTDAFGNESIFMMKMSHRLGI